MLLFTRQNHLLCRPKTVPVPAMLNVSFIMERSLRIGTVHVPWFPVRLRSFSFFRNAPENN